MMLKLYYAPDSAGYSAQDGTTTIATQLDGGRPRMRLDILNASAKVNATWNVGPDVYQYLKAFYMTGIKSGSLPFLIDLILDEPYTQEYEASFVPGSFSLQSQRGLAYTVTAQLDVKPMLRDEEFDNSLIDIIGIYGPEWSVIENLLEKLVNVDLPDALE